MKPVQRIKGVQRIIRMTILGRAVPKYITAGDRACGELMDEACRPDRSGPSDEAILAWAELELAKELKGGFWELRAA